MCFSSTTTQNSQNYTQNTLNPWDENFNYVLTRQARANVTQDPYQGYSGQTEGQFGPTWNAAATGAQQQLAENPGNFGAAASGFQSGMDNAAKTANTSITDLMSPYTSAVLSPTLDAINRQAAANNSSIAANATMSGAFGDTGYGTQKANNDYNTTQAIAGATGQAYNQAYQNAYGVQQNALSQLFSGAQGLGNVASSQSSSNTALNQLLANMGATQQQANQTGINTAINVNNQNQFGRLQQLALAAGAANTSPHDTFTQSYGQQSTTQPDNSGFGMLGSMLGGLL